MKAVLDLTKTAAVSSIYSVRIAVLTLKSPRKGNRSLLIVIIEQFLRFLMNTDESEIENHLESLAPQHRAAPLSEACFSHTSAMNKLNSLSGIGF